MAALREHGCTSPTDVALAVLEVDGSISVVRREDVDVDPAQSTAGTKVPRRPVRFLHVRR